MKKLAYTLLATFLFLSGCATNEGPEYDGHNYNNIKRYNIGTVVSQRPVVITDDGSGGFVGALVGSVLGSFIGRGRSGVLTTLAGGLGGYYVGKETGKANGAELSVKLDNGENVVIVVKGNIYMSGDRIKIIKDGNKVANIEKLSE